MELFLAQERVLVQCQAIFDTLLDLAPQSLDTVELRRVAGHEVQLDVQIHTSLLNSIGIMSPVVVNYNMQSSFPGVFDKHTELGQELDYEILAS